MKSSRAFLIRGWQEFSGDLPVWRFALVEIGQLEQTRGFATFSELMGFLADELRCDVGKEESSSKAQSQDGA